MADIDALISWGWFYTPSAGGTVVVPNKLHRIQITPVIDVPVTLSSFENVEKQDSNIKITITDPIKNMWIKTQKSDRLVSLGHIQTIPEYIRVLWQALQLYRPTLVFEPAYPSYILDVEDRPHGHRETSAPEIPDEIITWTLIRRTPGSIDHNPFAKAREIRERTREELVYSTTQFLDPMEPETKKGPGQVGSDREHGKVLGWEVKAQWFDNLIQFDIWCKDNKKAEQLAEFFENFMHDFHGMFIELGVIKTHFHSRIRDEFLLKWRNGLCNRSLIYYVRTETVRADTVREIRQINVNAEVKDVLAYIDDTGAGAFIEAGRNLVVQRYLRNKG